MISPMGARASLQPRPRGVGRREPQSTEASLQPRPRGVGRREPMNAGDLPRPSAPRRGGKHELEGGIQERAGNTDLGVSDAGAHHQQQACSPVLGAWDAGSLRPAAVRRVRPPRDGAGSTIVKGWEATCRRSSVAGWSARLADHHTPQGNRRGRAAHPAHLTPETCHRHVSTTHRAARPDAIALTYPAAS
jgi:hypothetical protein